jgi:hypothetical protein
VIVVLGTRDLRANWPFVRFKGIADALRSATARDKSDHSSLFLSACSTYRRGDAGAFAAPIRQAEGEVRGFIAGYRMTLGVAPSRFAPKMMSGNGRPYGVSQRLLDTSARRCRPFAAPNRQAEGEVYGFIAGYRMTLGAAPSRFAPKMMSGEWKPYGISQRLVDTSARRCRRLRRAESSGGRRSTRLHRRISHDTRGRTVTFCAENDLGRMEGLVVFLSACSTHRRGDAGRSPRQIVRRKAKYTASPQDIA